jgi:acetyl-CoA carboxylase biotin carboxyl carrier protein
LAYKQSAKTAGLPDVTKGTGEDCMSKNTHEADVAFVKALAELLRDNDLTELEVKRDYGEDDSLNVRVSRASMVAKPLLPARLF